MKPMIRILFCLFLMLPAGGIRAEPAAASMPMPGPPASNPHPPVSEQDKKRVAFAELVIKTLFEKSVFPSAVGTDHPNGRFGLHEACLKSRVCWSSQAQIGTYVAYLHSTWGQVEEHRHTHIIPWSMEAFEQNHGALTPVAGGQQKTAKRSVVEMSPTNLKPDEYILHTYARFSISGSWHHLDVIVSEDAQGQIKFERFYIVPLAYPHQDLPIGAVC